MGIRLLSRIFAARRALSWSAKHYAGYNAFYFITKISINAAAMSIIVLGSGSDAVRTEPSQETDSL